MRPHTHTIFIIDYYWALNRLLNHAHANFVQFFYSINEIIELYSYAFTYTLTLTVTEN